MAMPLQDLNFEFIDISKCQRSWNFGPLHKLPEKLPAWALGGFLISGFDLKEPHLVQNVPKATPAQGAELFYSLYPKLSWPELVRLIHRPDFETQIDPALLLTKYEIKRDERFDRTSQFLLLWPAEVQDYISEKEIRAFDVTILDSLPLDTQKDLLTLLVNLKPSKSLFCQMLELSAELLLMGTAMQELVDVLNAPKTLEELRKKRFPRTTEKDLAFKNSTVTLNWPKGTAAQAVRKGDLQGLEIKFFVKDALELEKILTGLQTVASDWKQKNEADPAL